MWYSCGQPNLAFHGNTTTIIRSLTHDNLLLVEPKTRLVLYGDREFCKATPKLWNRLPRDIRHSKSI